MKQDANNLDRPVMKEGVEGCPFLPQALAAKEENKQQDYVQMSVEDIKNIEKFRLGLWIAKASVVLMGTIVGVVSSTFAYLSYKMGTLPDAGALMTVFNQLKDILLIVIDAGK